MTLVLDSSQLCLQIHESIGHPIELDRVLGMESTGKNQVIKAQVPMSETLKYAADLRSMTGGRGYFTMEFDHYEVLPAHLTQEVIAARQKEKKEE